VIEIDKTLVSEILFERKFLCDLDACKGACCVEGDSGAPLENSEVEYLKDNIEKILPFLRKEGVDEIKKLGTSVIDLENDQVTPLINNLECAYTIFDEKGIAKCGIEKAHEAGAIEFIKPMSCHLYPIRVSKVGNYEALNYSKWEVCDPACKLGEAKGLKVYRFLETALVRKYGRDYFNVLEEVDKAMDKLKK
jgi:hypothetical protein